MQRNLFIEERPAKKDASSLEDASRGLARLVLTLLETLKDLMERQAQRRINDGSLTSNQIEHLGNAFMNLDEKIDSVARAFELTRGDLTLGLSTEQSNQFPRNMQEGRQANMFSLVDLLDHLVEKGAVVFGDLGLSVADVELITVQLRLVVSSVKGSNSAQHDSRLRVTEHSQRKSKRNFCKVQSSQGA